SRNCGDSFPSAPLAEALHCSPVTIFFCNVCNNDTNGLYIRGLEIFQEAMLITIARRDSIVSNEWLCENQNLSTIRRVGQGLWVANERGCKYSLARGITL